MVMVQEIARMSVHTIQALAHHLIYHLRLQDCVDAYLSMAMGHHLLAQPYLQPFQLWLTEMEMAR
jgi:hypothetical protein